VKYVTGFLFFWYDFLVGDAWEVALGAVLALAATALLVAAQPALAGILGPILAIVVMVLLVGSLWSEGRRT